MFISPLTLLYNTLFEKKRKIENEKEKTPLHIRKQKIFLKICVII